LVLFKRWGTYLYLASVALLAVNLEAVIHGIPSYPWLNYVLVAVVIIAALGQRLLRNSRWYEDYRKLVSRSIAWFFATTGLTLLALVQTEIPLFSVKPSALINLLLAVTVGLEFIVAGSLLYLSDRMKASEDEFGTKLKKKNSTANSDPVPQKPEGASSRADGNNILELIERVDDKFSQRKWPPMAYFWIFVLAVLGSLIYVTELTYQDLGGRFAIAAAGIAVVLSVGQMMLGEIGSWIATANYRRLRRGKEDLLLYALILMKIDHPGISLRAVHELNPKLFEPRALIESLYK